MIPRLFPKARRCLLLEDGAYAGESGALVASPRGRRILVSRALCQYRLFRPPTKLTLAQTARAARTWAEANAPFARTETLLLRMPGGGVGVWYWDGTRMAGADAERAAPESVQRPPGDGWRILACAEGFEAQHWGGGALLASTWRRAPFSRDQWRSFVLGADAPQEDAPDDPPAPQALPLDDGAAWRRTRIGPPLGWRDAEKLGGSAAIVGASLAAFFVGQALRSESTASADLRATSVITVRVARDHDAQRAREFEGQVGDYNRVMQGADVLAAATDAFQVYTQFGLQVTSWRANEREVHASFAGSLPQIPLHDVVQALEAKPTLCEVTPTFPRAQDGIEINARVADANGRCAGARGVGR